MDQKTLISTVIGHSKVIPSIIKNISEILLLLEEQGHSTESNNTFSINYKGNWNAATNSPLLYSQKGNLYDIYRVSTSGNTTLDEVSTWIEGEYLIYIGKWIKIPNTTLKVDTYNSILTSPSPGLITDTGVTIITDCNHACDATVMTTQATRNLLRSHMHPVGMWDAFNNKPRLVYGTGVEGFAYIVSKAGTQTVLRNQPTDYKVGDIVYYTTISNTWEIY